MILSTISTVSNAQSRKFVLLVLLMSLVFVVGCPPTHPPLNTLVSVDEIITDHNRNAAKVPRLWARAHITMREKAGAFPLGADGILMLNKTPGVLGVHDFVLVFKKTGEELGRIGISTRESVYYMWMKVGDNPSCLWGRLGLAGAEGVEIPINPVQLLSVLTVCELPSVLTRVPFVAQTISFDPPAYVLTYVDRQPISNKLRFTRKIYFLWSEKDPPKPFMVELLDTRGVAVLTAKLSDYKTISSDVSSDDAQPMMPTDIQLTWNQTGAELNLKLYKMTTAERIDPEDIIEAYSFRSHDNFPDTITNIKCVDAHLIARDTKTKGTTQK